MRERVARLLKKHAIVEGSLEDLRQWISLELFSILRFDDEILVDLVLNSVTARKTGKEMVELLAGFLDASNEAFVTRLWEKMHGPIGEMERLNGQHGAEIRERPQS